MTRQARSYLGIFLTSGVIILLELLFSRIYSVVLFYHFGFFSLSLALLGLGAAGILVYRYKNFINQDNLSSLLGYAALTLVVTLILNFFYLANLSISLSTSKLILFVNLFFIAAANFLPLFSGGLIVTLLLFKFPQKVSQLYFFDLIGAATAAALFPIIISWLGAVNSILFATIVSVLIALIFSPRHKAVAFKLITKSLLVIFVVGLAFNLTWGIFDLNYNKFDNSELLFSRWNSFSHVGVYKTDHEKVLKVRIDANASTNITNYDYDLNNLSDKKDWIQGIAYEIKKQPEVLIIGPGAGTDVIIALQNDAEKIIGVEVNPIMINEIMLGEFQQFSSDLYKNPKVNIVIDEGRSYVKRSKDKYDIILASLVDTWAASAVGAFSLTENNLYTVEAFTDYLGHLKEDGLLTFSRWIFLEQPRETLRLLAVARQAAELHGIDDVSQHMILVSEQPAENSHETLATLILKNSRLTELEIDQITKKAMANGYDILYAPNTQTNNLFSQLITTAEPNTFYQAYELDVSPTTDNKPFFFFNIKAANFFKAGLHGDNNNLGIFILIILLFSLITLTVLFILIPQYIWFKNQPKNLNYFFYFASLGLGFMFVEVALMQKLILFLGQPIYALTVVLAGLLLFSGLGSFVTKNVSNLQARKKIIIIVILLIILIIIYRFILTMIINETIESSLAVRIFISLLFIAPLGFLMGMPFPLGIKKLESFDQNLIPWVWAVNGFFSVLAAALAIVIAIYLGFNAVLLLGATSYLIAWLAIVKFRG